MTSVNPAQEVYEAILAGSPADVISPRLNQLARDERQNLLCTVCTMHYEIASNCIETATAVSALLAAECPFYVDGIATCLL